MISIHDLYKRFKKLKALDDINVSFHKGDAIALIGPNGSGKTTLIKSILGLVKPDSGKILFDGELIEKAVNYREKIGYMPQIGRYPDNMKIGQLFSMLKDIRGKDQPLDEELYYSFHLDQLANKPMQGLSGGTRQKVSAAIAFLFDAPVLILDEPTAGLDPLAAEILKDKILKEKQKGKLILITSHVLTDLEDMVTHIMYLQDGKMQFYKTLEDVQMDTGHFKLSKAIAHMMKHGAGPKDKGHLRIAN